MNLYIAPRLGKDNRRNYSSFEGVSPLGYMGKAGKRDLSLHSDIKFKGQETKEPGKKYS
jgi:hypothetical protein